MVLLRREVISSSGSWKSLVSRLEVGGRKISRGVGSIGSVTSDSRRGVERANVGNWWTGARRIDGAGEMVTRHGRGSTRGVASRDRRRLVGRRQAASPVGKASSG